MPRFNPLVDPQIDEPSEGDVWGKRPSVSILSSIRRSTSLHWGCSCQTSQDRFNPLVDPQIDEPLECMRGSA
jgi:hypothetical protein